ncbi:MAG: hypothetical protein MI747_06570, partial [Desulfobacterales bacterium]|nr:hypothetical protein [Desulfobacterales bacterium]
IMLIAQIYHIGEHYPDGILYWALGVMPLGLLTGSSLLLSLSTLLGFIWLSVETGLNYFPTFFPLFLLSLAAFLVWCKPNRSLFMALVMGLGLFLEYCLAWGLGQGRGFEFGMDCLALAWCFFVVCHGIALWMGRRPEQDFKDYGLLLGLWSLRFFFVVLLALGFEGIWDAIFDAQWQYPGLFFALALGAGGFHVWAARSPSLIGGHLFFLVLFYGALFPGEWASPLFFQVLSNLVMVILGAGLIVQGIREHRSHYFFLGICAVLVTGLFRYMDLIGDYLGSAALFAGCALILLISARYWKQHQGGDHG